jgi:hypothetical protein
VATYTESAWGSTDATYPTSVLTKRWDTTNETTVAANSDTDATSDYTFEQEWSVASDRLNSLDAVDGDSNRSNSEVLLRWKFNGTETFANRVYGAVIRGSGSAGSENGYVVKCYHGSNNLTMELTKFVSGTETTIKTNAALSHSDPQIGDYIYLRMRVNGSSIKARYWVLSGANTEGTTQEPAYWLIDETDTSVTGNGWVGIYGEAASRNCETDWMSVGTNGDTAPFVVDTTASTRISSQYAQVLAKDTSPEFRISSQYAQVLAKDTSPEFRISSQYLQVLYKAAPPTYIETQWGSSAGVFPTSILTKRWHTANETTNACQALTEAEDGYVLEAEWSASARRFLSWDTLDADAGRDDIELLARFHLEGTSRVDLEFGLIVRGSGTDTTETGYVVFLEEFTTNDIRLQIGEYSSGTFSLLGTSAVVFENMDSRWCYLRFRADGTAIKAKLWQDGYQTEPTAWDLEVTDSTHTAAGWNGIYCGAASRLFTLDYLSAATESATAPKRYDADNPYRLTTAQVHSLQQDTNTPVRLTTAQVHSLQQDTNTPVRLTTAQVHVLYLIQTQDVRLTQQVAELAVYQNLANIEARSTQQIVEVLVQFRGQVTQQMAELAVQQNLANVEARSTQQIVEVLGKILSFQVSQQVAELVVYQNLANIEARSTQQLVEVLFQSEVRFGVTQQIAELGVYQNLANVVARSTQQIVEVLLTVVGSRVTQQVAEAAVYQNLANIEARSTQQVIEVLLESIPNPQLTQQVAELAVYQNLANIEARSTQQVVEVVLETINYGRVSQQVAEAAVYQNLANIEARSTQQIIEVLFFTGLEKVIIVTQSVAETAVRQNADSIDVSSTHQIIEVLITVVALDGPAYDNFDAQPISIMV